MFVSEAKVRVELHMLIVKSVEDHDCDNQHKKVGSYTKGDDTILVDSLSSLRSILVLEWGRGRLVLIRTILNRSTLIIKDLILLKTYIFDPEHQNTTEKRGILCLSHGISEE